MSSKGPYVPILMRITWSCLALFFWTPVLALEGQVVLPDGSPVVGAQVLILGQTVSTRADRSGSFSWHPDPQVPFEVQIILPDGHYTLPVLIEKIPAQGPLEIHVSFSSETITVTSGSASDETPAAPASATTGLARQALEQQQQSRLTDLLETIPGVSHVSESHAKVPTIRGLAGGRTLVLIDGERVSTERRAGPSASYLDPFFLDRVEVVRGPGSLAYGADAFGGVIHALTRKPEPGAPLRFRFLGTLAAGLPEQSAGLELSRGWDQSGMLFQARMREFDDYRSPLGKVDNSGAKTRSFLARTHFRRGPGQLHLGWLSDLGRDIGRPMTGSSTSRTFYPREDSHRLTLSYQLDPFWKFSQVKLNGFFGGNELFTDRDQLLADSDLRRIERAEVSAKDFGFRTAAVVPLRRTRVEFGVDLNGRFDLQAVNSTRELDNQGRVTRTDQQTSIQGARRANGAPYVTTQTWLGNRLSLSSGARWDHSSTRNDGGALTPGRTENDDLSGFLALTVGPFEGFSLTGQVARGVRDPTLSDRYFEGISGRGFVTGNPDLDQESSLQWDLAARLVQGAWRFSLFAYHYRIKDLIERFESGEDQFFFRNQGRARLRGLELEVEGELTEGLSLALGSQLAYGTELEEGTPLAGVPAPNIRLALRKRMGESGYLLWQAIGFARDDSPGPTEAATPGYVRSDLGFGWRVHSQAEFRFVLRNLLDKDYPAGLDRRAVLAPGRTALLSLLLSL